MRYSGDAYYDESNLMDLKVMGTMGLTEQDVSALKNVDGVETAEGAYSTDVLLGGSDAVQVLHVESLNEEVNQVTVSEGRLPERSGECFLDKEFADSGDYKVGDTITVVQDGDSELLKKETFTVTGLGSSLFIFPSAEETLRLVPEKSTDLCMCCRKILIKKYIHRFTFGSMRRRS